jgi:serine/threonine protein kinase
VLPIGLGAGALLLALCAVGFWRSGRSVVVASAGSSAPGIETPERKRRGTLSYETDEIVNRPSSSPDNEVPLAPRPATARVAAGGGGVAYPQAERARFDTSSSTFGRYRLLERLGEGGMAEIYTAVLHGAEGFRRVFVVKRLRPQVARNRAAVEQFIDEAKLGSTLVHPNIVPVFDFGKVGDEYFMAQEYIVGRDITRLLQRHMERVGRPLDERLVLYLVHEVLDALAYAHNQTDGEGRPLALVHRDISPGNIMITARGEVKLFDFGIVKAEGRVSKTEVGVVKGNVSFMSPEQARGLPVDGRSDLFSLGLVMYYALTNDALYPGDSTFDRLMKAASGPRTEHLQRVAQLPPLSASLLGRALATDPALRYQSAAEFEAELVPHITGARAEAVTLMQRLFGPEFRREMAI